MASDAVQASGAEVKTGEGQLPPYASASLYVGDLNPEVTEGTLFELFSRVGHVASIRVCRDTVTRRSLGYGYVNMQNVQDAERALEEMNNFAINGRCCRVMWSQRDPSARKSGAGNIFIKNLHLDIDVKILNDTFACFGKILSCKVVLDESGKSKGYGFVHYANAEDAEKAIADVNGAEILKQIVSVEKFIPKRERVAKMGDPRLKFTNVYVKNLPSNINTQEDLVTFFSKFGKVTSAYLAADDSKSKGFGFVNFESSENAHAAIEALNDKELDGKVLFVGRAQKKGERESEMRQKIEQLKQERNNKFQGVNLFVKNLDDTIDDNRLREEFKAFGTITSCKVMLDEKGLSKGFGFVCFMSPEETMRAVQEMNSHMLGSKPIYVALAQRKEQRRAQLEQQHNQRKKLAIPGLGANMAMSGAYPPGAQLYYPQAGMGAPQNMMYSGALMPRGNWAQGTPFPAGMPNQYMVPQMRNGAQGGRGAAPVRGGGRGARRGAQGRGPQNQGPMMVQNMGQPMMGVPSPVGGNVPLQQMVVQPLDAKMISALQPEQQKLVVGEKLYPLIYVREPNLAGKITGMLLDSYFTEELIHLLETPEHLHAKVDEALAVLKQHAEQHPEQMS